MIFESRRETDMIYVFCEIYQIYTEANASEIVVSSQGCSCDSILDKHANLRMKPMLLPSKKL